MFLTHKQRSIFEFIQQYFSERQQSPLIREIQSGCQIASYKSVLDRLNALERKGYIKRVPSKHRGIRLTRKLPAVPSASSSFSALEQILERTGEPEGDREGASA